MLTWDGVLPLAVVLSPFILRALFPHNKDVNDVVGVIIVPIVAAILRTVSGGKELQRVCPEKPSALRQLSLAASIIVLIGFEMAANMIHVAADIRGYVWFYITGMYLAYLFLIFFALKPASIA
jgi:hypothetical protein